MDATDPNQQTREAEQVEARSAHDADREPTEAESRAAESRGPVDGSVAEHFEEMNELGAQVEGEGQID